MVLSPGVTMELGGGGLTTVQLVGGPDRSRRRVHLHRQRPAERARRHGDLGRPGLRAAARRRARAGPSCTWPPTAGWTPPTRPSATSAPPPPTRRTGPAVTFSTGSTGSLVRTTVLRNSTGVRLNGSNGVRLEGLDRGRVGGRRPDAAGRPGHHADRRARRAQRRERGAGQRARARPGRSPASAPPATASSGWPWSASRPRRSAGIVTQADRVGGLQLSGDTNPVVTDFSAVDQPIGVLTHVSSSNVTLGQLRISGGGRGIVVEKTTDGWRCPDRPSSAPRPGSRSAARTPTCGTS